MYGRLEDFDDLVEIEPDGLECTDVGDFGYLEGHLNSPITKTECEYLIETKEEKQYCRRHTGLITTIKSFEKEHGIVEKTIYNTKCHPWNCLATEVRKTPCDTTYNLFTVTFRAALTAANAASSPFVTNIYKDITMPSSTSRVYLSFINQRKAEVFKDKICFREIKRGEVLKFSRRLWIDPDITLFCCSIHNQACIIPSKLLLGVVDRVQNRHMLYLTWWIADCLRKFKSSIYKIGTEMIDLIEELEETLPDTEFYVFLSKLEAYIKGCVIALPDDLKFTSLRDLTYDKLNSLKVYHDEISDDYRQRRLKNYSCIDKITTLIQTSAQTETYVILDLIGLSKCFGYPCVDVSESIKKIREVACEQSNKPDIIYEEIEAQFRKEFLKRFWLANRRFPRHIANRDDMKEKLSYNHWNSELENTNLLDFNSVTFLKEFDFDHGIDAADILKDKAICPDYKFWASGYDKCAFMWRHNHAPFIHRDGITRRLMVRFCDGTEEEIARYIEETDNGDFVLTTNGWIVFCPKEREIKVYCRMFCKQTYVARCSQVLQEMNLARFICPYMPFQTVTIGEHKLLEREDKILKKLNNPNTETI